MLEWPAKDAEILFFGRRVETDQRLLDDAPHVFRFTLRRFIRGIRNPEVDLIEVAEPMWISEWPRHFAAVILARLTRSCTRRGSLVVATYAIENLDWQSRFTLPFLDRWPRGNRIFATVARTILDITASISLDVIVFGSPGAKANYLASMPLTTRSTRHLLLLDELNSCPCINIEQYEHGLHRRVLFIGENSDRKGIDILLDAWNHVQKCSPPDVEWELRVAGPGFEDSAFDCPTIIFEGRLPRHEVYDRLAEADVVVLPSRRVKRWREQKGLPIIEGLRHGCRVVTTSETGLADLISNRDDVWIASPDSSKELADALLKALNGPSTTRVRCNGYVHSDSTRAKLWSGVRALLT